MRIDRNSTNRYAIIKLLVKQEIIIEAVFISGQSTVRKSNKASADKMISFIGSIRFYA
jgi:hypothetical protein